MLRKPGAVAIATDSASQISPSLLLFAAVVNSFSFSIDTDTDEDEDAKRLNSVEMMISAIISCSFV